MNTPILFLLGAVALSALGGLVVWVLSRPRPERFGSSIDTFNRDLSALAPPSSRSHRPASGRRNKPGTVRGPAPTPRVGAPAPRSSPSHLGTPRSGAPAAARPKPGPRPKG